MKTHCPTSRRRLRRVGFTLIEATISAMVVGLLATASLSAIGTASTTKLRQTDLNRGYALAGLFMSEILQQNYTDPNGGTGLGPDAGEVRATFNDVDDYNGYTQSSAPTYQNGTAIPGYTNWSVSVAVVYANATNPGGASVATDSGVKRITVSVVDPRGRTTRLVGLRSKYGRYDQTPGSSTTYLNYVGVDLQVGTDAKTSVSSGVNPLNQVP